MISYCPNCNARIVTGYGVTDYVHDCSTNTEAPPAVKNEDIVITGNWEDYSGSGTKASQEVLRQGNVNELQGTRAGIEGLDKEELTRRGVRQSTHRQRAHLEFIDIKEKVRSRAEDV